MEFFALLLACHQAKRKIYSSAVSLDSLDSLIEKPSQNEAAFERGLSIR